MVGNSSIGLVTPIKSMSAVRHKGRKGGGVAAKAVVQLLFSTGKSFTVDGLREKPRELFDEEARGECGPSPRSATWSYYRAPCFQPAAGPVGLQLRITNGVVSLFTTRVENKALAAYVSEQSGASGNLQMTSATLEVLACIAFRQPISQPEIDRLFAADKRGLVVKLRDLKLVEEFAGADGRLRFATNGRILAAFRPGKFAAIDGNFALGQSTRHRTVCIKPTIRAIIVFRAAANLCRLVRFSFPGAWPGAFRLHQGGVRSCIPGACRALCKSKRSARISY